MDGIERPIDGRSTIDDIIARHPSCIFVFNTMGIDTCGGGSETLAAAAKHAHLNPDLLVASLHAAIRG